MLTVAAPAIALLAQTAAIDLAPVLARAVDLESPTERADAARSLAERREIPLANWLAATENFGSFSQVEPGTSTVRVPLFVAGATEETELCIHVPRAYDASKPTPLLLALHFTGGTGASALPGWRALAEELGWLVLAPSEAGANDGYGWTERERGSVLAALRWMRRHYDVDEDRIVVTGFSRGGHMAWDLALRHPGIFAAVAPMAGSPRCTLTRGQNNTRYLEHLIGTPVRDLQGAQDDELLVFGVRLAFRRLEEFGARDARLVEFAELGHDVDTSAVDWRAFLGAVARDPRPARVVQIAAADGSGRHAWIEIESVAEGVEESFPLVLPRQQVKALANSDKLELCDVQARKKSARLEVERLAPGRFSVRAEKVEQGALYLTSADFDPAKPVEVKLAGRTAKRVEVAPDPAVLLADFVERFDRRFQPVARVEVRP